MEKKLNNKMNKQISNIGEINRLREKYTGNIKDVLAEEFNIKNIFAVPKLEKVIVNMGVGSISKNQQQMDLLAKDLAAITGQMPSVRKARISVAGFSLRAGMPVGLSVTLRGEKMYSFLDRLFSIVLPRLRDFRGVSVKSFDKTGNYTLGFEEHTVFPEIDSAKSAASHGFEVTIVTTAGSVEKSKRLLELLGMPFSKEVKD